MFLSLSLLVVSNIFMTIAWYGHLKNHQHSTLLKVILISWCIAFVEYCFQVPGNRIGVNFMTIPQLKVAQEIIAMTVFAVFAVTYLKVPLTKNFLYASVCLVFAAFFMFKDRV